MSYAEAIFSFMKLLEKSKYISQKLVKQEEDTFNIYITITI